MILWSSRARSVALGVALLALPACGARSELPTPELEAEDVDDPDLPKSDCVAEGVTFVYLMTSENHLLRFDPGTLSLSRIGVLDCPDGDGTGANSMAVDRKGVAYVSFHSGALYRVSTATAACKATSFVPGQQGFGLFGMGFSTDGAGPQETLFVAEGSFGGQSSKGLGAIDTKTFDLSFIAPFSTDIGDAVELTGTGDGRLFGLPIDTRVDASSIVEIDKTTGDILSTVELPIGRTSAFAFAFWGGDFYVFHAETPAPSTVTRFRPSDGSIVDVARLGTVVVGAGVSTCAPE